MNRIRRIVLVLVAVTVQGCNVDERAGAQGASSEAELFDQRITFQQVLQRLRDDDAGRVSRTIVQLDPHYGRPNIRALLFAAWEGDRASYPDLNWTILRTQRVRIALARVLGSHEPVDTRYRDYVLQMSEQAADMNDRFEALFALGAIARDEDLTRLQGIAVGSDTLRAHAALAGLVSSNKPEARQAVQKISMDPAMPEERRKFAGELLALPRPPQ